MTYYAFDGTPYDATDADIATLRSTFPALDKACDDVRAFLIGELMHYGYNTRHGAAEHERRVREYEEAQRVKHAQTRVERIMEARIPHDKLKAYDAGRPSTARYAAALGPLCERRRCWLFSGPSKTGKSMTAAQVLLHWLDQGASVYWWDLVSYCALMADGIDHGIDNDEAHTMRSNARRASVVVWDDLGKDVLHKGDGKTLTWLGQKIHAVAEQRRAEGKVNIVTSEHDIDALAKQITPALVTRVFWD